MQQLGSAGEKCDTRVARWEGIAGEEVGDALRWVGTDMERARGDAMRVGIQGPCLGRLFNMTFPLTGRLGEEAGNLNWTVDTRRSSDWMDP